jgi:hypothetical protein
MKTDELIDALSQRPEPVDARDPVRRLLVAAALGLAAALPLMLWQLGLNPELAVDAHRPMFWVKFAVVFAVAVASAVLLLRLGRPGSAVRRAGQATAAPFLALWTLAVLVLLAAAPGERLSLVMGSSWNFCPIAITLLSLPALFMLFAAARSLAPTRLRLAGAATGLCAGAVGTLAYLLHCPEMEAPFVAVWYVLGMALPAALGALLGRRLLVW